MRLVGWLGSRSTLNGGSASYSRRLPDMKHEALPQELSIDHLDYSAAASGGVDRRYVSRRETPPGNSSGLGHLTVSR